MVQPLVHLVLYQPVIPQNTGSIARLTACTGTRLHLIHPLGFKTDEASVRRAGLDYWEHVDIREHADWNAFLTTEAPERLFLFTKWADKPYDEADYSGPVYLVFGNESLGLPAEIHEQYQGNRLWIPMRSDIVRSLNLAQAAAIVAYEALRQQGFGDLKDLAHAPRGGIKRPLRTWENQAEHP
jgi:tRNA (cytidine/uridine-2'-O-)-methyltransferase